MIDTAELSIAALVLECIPKTRTIKEADFWAKYERLCAKHGVLPLPGQVKTALRRLNQEGRIIVNRYGARKL
jgi:adenosylmethionine-8-amino-7-oxononanoate aminotransferase